MIILLYGGINYEKNIRFSNGAFNVVYNVYG